MTLEHALALLWRPALTLNATWWLVFLTGGFIEGLWTARKLSATFTEVGKSLIVLVGVMSWAIYALYLSGHLNLLEALLFPYLVAFLPAPFQQDTDKYLAEWETSPQAIIEPQVEDPSQEDDEESTDIETVRQRFEHSRSTP